MDMIPQGDIVAQLYIIRKKKLNPNKVVLRLGFSILTTLCTVYKWNALRSSKG